MSQYIACLSVFCKAAIKANCVTIKMAEAIESRGFHLGGLF